ncbi:unnamed protein product [Lota lota]
MTNWDECSGGLRIKRLYVHLTQHLLTSAAQTGWNPSQHMRKNKGGQVTELWPRWGTPARVTSTRAVDLDSVAQYGEAETGAIRTTND